MTFHSRRVAWLRCDGGHTEKVEASRVDGGKAYACDMKKCKHRGAPMRVMLIRDEREDDKGAGDA